jgi:two-component system cell cycle response regulator
MKILVADDSKTHLMLISMVLKKLGHTVIPVESGLQAVAHFEQDKPDLIILDVMMEDMDGFQCAKKLREIDSEDWIPIIFLSASVDDDSISQGINAGGDDYLTKPFSEITLAAKIKAMDRISTMRKKLCEATEKLTILSSTDSLTGLYNRFQLSKSINEKIAHVQRHKCGFTFLFIDLDHFKWVNDNLGHDVGDLLLQSVAQRLQSCVRANDIIARMGGDEFAIILDEVQSIDIAMNVTKKIIDIVSAPYTLAQQEVKIGASIGVACYPTDASDPETLLKNADTAMYYAKNHGRNNFQCFVNLT